MFKGLSIKELKFYFGFGFLFFVLTTFLFTNLFFRVIYDSTLSLYVVLLIHDVLYFLSYSLQIYLLSLFFKLNLERTVLFTIPQFYIYEYLSGFFVQGIDYFIFAPKVIALRLIVLAIGSLLIYLSVRYFVRHN